MLMFLFYFYTGVYGGDHDKPRVAYCAIISEWNATESLILYVYIGNDYKNISSFAEIKFLMLLLLLLFSLKFYVSATYNNAVISGTEVQYIRWGGGIVFWGHCFLVCQSSTVCV